MNASSTSSQNMNNDPYSPCDFQERLMAAQHLKELVKSTRQKLEIESSGRIMLLHSTSNTNAQSVMECRRFNEGSYFAPSKAATQPHALPKHQTDVAILRVVIDPRDIKFSTGSGEFYAPTQLTQSEFGTWMNPMRLADQEAPVKNDANVLSPFQQWFEGSQVIDDNGMPQMVFHNSPTANITEFRPFARDALNGDKSKADIDLIIERWKMAEKLSVSDFRVGTFFTPSKTDYAQYGAHQYAVYLKVLNPIVMNGKTGQSRIFDRTKCADALIIMHDGRIDEIAVLHQDQIRFSDTVSQSEILKYQNSHTIDKSLDNFAASESEQMTTPRPRAG